MKMVLSQRQREELNKAIAEYMYSNGYVKKHFDVNKCNDKTKPPNM